MKNQLAVLWLAAGIVFQARLIARQVFEPGPLTRVPPIAKRVATGPLQIACLAQNSICSDGQASVAMAINYVTGKALSEREVEQRYGYELLRALREECAQVGLTWVDGGEIGPDKWSLLEQKICNEHLPVVLALNGPEFCPSGRGHIVLVCGLEGDKVTFADPATGTLRTSTRQTINVAPQHPQGNFVFYANRVDPLR